MIRSIASRALVFLSLSLFFSCDKNLGLEERTPSVLDGSYIGNAIIVNQNSINGFGWNWSDTVDLYFSIQMPEFEHGPCEGSITVQSDTIYFESGECGCWCDCSPYADCLGDILLGWRQFSFDSDSLKMWIEVGNVDTLSFPGFELGWHRKAVFSLKKQN